MFGKTQPPPTTRPAWTWRALAALVRGLARAIAWAIRLGIRYGWRYRQLLAPLYVGFWLAVAALLLAGHPQAWPTITALAVASAGTLAVWMRHQRRRRGRRLHIRRRVYAWTSLAVATAWMLTATTAPLPLPWAAGIHTALTVAAAVPWMWDRRVRRATATRPEVAIYNERLAAPGRKLAGTQLTNVKDGTGNIEWEGVIVGEPGLFTTDMAVAAQRHIASAYKRARANVIVEPAPDEAMDTARLMMVRANQTYAGATYDDSWHDLQAGSVPLTTYPDGSRGRIAIWVPGAGCRNAVFSGDSGVGKSKGMTLCATQVAFTGLAVTWFGCPQDGQSSPAYAGRDGLADYIARTPERCVEMLASLYQAMFARSTYLAEMPYAAPNGKIRHGVARYDPDLVVVVDGERMPLGAHMPILDVYVDELPMVLAVDPGVRPLVAQIAKMVSKTGGRLTVGVQMPSIGELGNDDTIRQNLKANVVAFRNSEGVAKGMILSPWMPSPSSIPAHPPGRPTEHTLGTCVLESVAPNSARATFSRTVFIEDDFEAAEMAYERRPALDEITAKGCGEDYYQQWQTWGKTPKVVGATGLIAEPEAQAGRETVTVTAPAASPAPVARGPRPGTVAARAIEYLAARGEPATTGVIAQAIGVPKGQVSQALGRDLKRAGSRVRKIREGVWVLADHQTSDQQTEEVAA